MKKLVYTPILFIAALLLFVACTKPEGEQLGTNPDDYSESKLSPGEHKSKLEDIAIEFVDKFDPNDTDDLVESAMALAEYMEDFDYADDMYMDTNSLICGLKNFSNDDLVKFATRATEKFVIDPDDPDFNIFAGKRFVYEDYYWEDSDLSNNKSIVFEWDDAKATIDWTKTTKYEYYYDEDDMNIVAFVPNKIEITITIDGKEHLYIGLNTNISNLKTWAPETTVRINGGYEFKSSVSGNSKGLEAQTSFTKDGKSILRAAAVVAINDFTDIDNWFYEYYSDYYEEYMTYLNPGEYFMDHVKTGSAQLDILNLSCVMKGDFKDLAKKIEEYDDQYDYYDEDWNYLPDQAKKYYEKVCKLINDNIDIVIVYNDTKELVAEVAMSVAKEYDDWDDEYHYYAEPVLVFSDGSKYAFYEYFTERAFGDLIEEIGEIAEYYEDMI